GLEPENECAGKAATTCDLACFQRGGSVAHGVENFSGPSPHGQAIDLHAAYHRRTCAAGHRRGGEWRSYDEGHGYGHDPVNVRAQGERRLRGCDEEHGYVGRVEPCGGRLARPGTCEEEL